MKSLLFQLFPMAALMQSKCLYSNKDDWQYKKVVFMAKRYQCTICGYIYDPEKGDPDSGIAPNTPFEELPESWTCPQCGAPKSDFVELK